MRGSWRQNRTATYWPPTLMAITVFFSRSPGLLAWGPTLLGAAFLYHILSPTAWTSCAPSYIVVRRPPSSCGRHKSHSFKPSTVKVIFWYSSTGCTCYLHWCISYFDSLAGVNMQHNNLCTVIWYQVFLTNTKNLHTTIYQVFLSNTNKFCTIIWLPLTCDNTFL